MIQADIQKKSTKDVINKYQTPNKTTETPAKDTIPLPIEKQLLEFKNGLNDLRRHMAEQL